MTMQEKILSELRSLTEAAEFEFVKNTDYTNTGHVFIMNGWDTIAAFNYNFQTKYFGFTTTRKADEASTAEKELGTMYTEYDSPDMEVFIGRFEMFVQDAAQAVEVL